MKRLMTSLMVKSKGIKKSEDEHQIFYGNATLPTHDISRPSSCCLAKCGLMHRGSRMDPPIVRSANLQT